MRLFLRRVVIDQAFPLELKVLNAQTRAAMEESCAMMAARRARFASADELCADLEKKQQPVNARCRHGLPMMQRHFLKDWPCLSHSGWFDRVRLKEVMLRLIANDAPLGPEWQDHSLKGEWADHRECHIGGDFLLIYQLEANWINFVRAGTHSELFGN